jgi:L-histidine Nalpha-methyltransferase / hercynylcysteine S-oxide synthase
MAYKPTFSVSSDPAVYASQPVPSLTDFNNLWVLWDTVTRQMIPKQELLSKPIKLRNACIFYLGHIPTFSDIHLSKATGDHPPELAYYRQIFERGIDPDVDNPELCHSHSEIPDTWPAVEEILKYQTAVRDRIKALLTPETLESSPALRKALWIGYEHEAMHLETLLYMLIQSEKTLPPAGVVVPDFEAEATAAASMTVPNEWIKIAPKTISIGLNESNSNKQHFGWDNEVPLRSTEVGAFLARTQPITNREYAQYLLATGKETIPASWVPLHNSNRSNGWPNGFSNGNMNGSNTILDFISDKAVRTVFGKVPLKYALDWPVMASYNELVSCATWLGGRIPSMEEVRSIYEHVDSLRAKSIQNRAETIPAVNSHLSNDGVEETPPQNGASNGVNGLGSNESDPSTLFADLSNANVGFKAWHPVPVTGLTTLPGQSELGGVWEWTSSVLEQHEGFEAMKLYPGYTGKRFLDLNMC